MESRDPFREPPWDAPLDVPAELRGISNHLTQKGMFLAPMVAEAKKRGIVLPSARDRYVPFHDYPLREHATLLSECAIAFYPDLSPRQALRRLGRAAYMAFLESTVGKVVWSTVNNDPHAALHGILRGYEIAVPGCSARLVETRPRAAVIRLERVPYFLDCHHVGCVEGALKSVGLEGKIKLRIKNTHTGDFLCEW